MICLQILTLLNSVRYSSPTTGLEKPGGLVEFKTPIFPENRHTKMWKDFKI